MSLFDYLLFDSSEVLEQQILASPFILSHDRIVDQIFIYISNPAVHLVPELHLLGDLTVNECHICTNEICSCLLDIRQ